MLVPIREEVYSVGQISAPQGNLLIIGDLNIMLARSNKRGGSLFNYGNACILNNFINDTGFFDLGYVGGAFTRTKVERGQNHSTND